MVQNNGLEFEYLVQAFFEERGVSVFETPGSNDYGADLVLYRNGKIAVIQCKCHSSPVGIHAVQEVTGAIKHYGADAGIVISNQPFTRQAVALAHSNHVLLIAMDACCRRRWPAFRTRYCSWTSFWRGCKSTALCGSRSSRQLSVKCGG